MNCSGRDFVGQPATALARSVRLKISSPVEIVRAHLDHIAAVDPRVGAFQRRLAEPALLESDRLVERNDLADLPLAGVPVAIKDNVPVAGEPTRSGSAATSEAPSAADHEVVRRLRAAGAVVVGKTRLPELGGWATTDGAFGIARNPWNLERTTGGSSGGSAAAVSAAMVPVALGNDGLGSIRIPSACCGVFGIKPGRGILPSDLGVSSWFGMVENGPLATTVDDAALVLSVLANRPEFREPRIPDRPLRIAVSTRAPIAGVRVDPELSGGTLATAQALERAGHHVALADPPYSMAYGVAVLARWCAAVEEEAAELPRGRLEPRTRAHIRAGWLARHLGRIRANDRTLWTAALDSFFSAYDVLLTPTLAKMPPPARRWSQASWVANLKACIGYAPFAGAWNFAGYPAAAVPAGRHSNGMPLSIQLIAPHGHEMLLLSVAKQLETVCPWPRHAPIANVSAVAQKIT